MYGRKFKNPISWDNPTYEFIIGVELLKDMEDHMVKIKWNLKLDKHRQGIYADHNKNTRQFQVGDHVFLKVRQKKSSLNLGNCSNLAAR